MWWCGVPPSSTNLTNSLAPSANHSNLRIMDLADPSLLWLKIEKTNDEVACAIRLGNEDFLTSFCISSSSKILFLNLCRVSSHTWATCFSFLRQRNKDASVSSCFHLMSQEHLSDLSRAASSLMSQEKPPACCVPSPASPCFHLRLISLSFHTCEQDQIGFFLKAAC